jgi:hypothetical protein
VRRDGGGRLEGVREYGGHRRWRILPGMPAGTAESGDRFRQPWGTIRRGKGGGKAEGSGGFIGEALVDNQGVGNARGNDSGDVTGRGEGEVVMGVMTGGSHLSAREREKEGTGSG